jgi:hypothetical protein
MTREEFSAIGLATWGFHWRDRMGAAIGIDPVRIRRIADGEEPAGDDVEAAIRRVLGAGAIADPDWPRDAWIVGDAKDDLGARREYIMHARRPRFVARIVMVDDEGRPEPGEEPADVLTGVVYASDDFVLCEIVWIDPAPPSGELRALLEAACDAIDESGES